jgi:Immunity protein 26
MKKVHANIGDVFAIKLTNEEYVFGQIVFKEIKENGIPKCYIIYDYKSKDIPELKDIINKEIIALTYTSDIFIENKRWKNLGNSKTPYINYPKYLLGDLENLRVVDHKGEYIRKASETDKENLTYHTSVTPKVIEKLVEALFNNGEWYKTMDIQDLIYKNY